MDTIKKLLKSKNIWETIAKLTEQELEEVIRTSAESYYNTSISLISDEIYDILVDRLKNINPKSTVLKKIGAPVRGKKVKLPYWMGSMDKIKAKSDLIDKWIKTYKGPYATSDKLDGISCLLYMKNGQVNLYTRGDGAYGQDITHLLGLINISYETLVKQKGTIAIRGELIMTKKNFEKYAKKMSNARNMVGGIVNSKKESINKKQAADVDFISYEIIEPRFKPSEQFVVMEKWNMDVVHNDLYDTIDLTILENILKKRKKKSPYEIDGIIVTDDQKHSRNISGNPPYSFAFKGTTPTADVKVIEVIWTPSKDGYIIPRIRFEKVRLSQADLEYATGFNAKFIVDNNIGPNAIITVVRSGDVIPYVIGVIKPAKKPALPKDMDFVWDENSVNIMLANADKNETVIIRRLTKFLNDIGVENMSIGIVTRLVNEGYDTIPKIISLTVDDLLEIDGFKSTLATKLINNLQTRLADLNILTLMVASNIFGRGFGERKLKKIFEIYPDIVQKYDNKKNHTQWHQKLMDLEGFDTISVDKFLEALPDFQKFYVKINKLVNIKPYLKKVKKEGIFMGETVVFTGFRNKNWQEFIEKEGGRLTGSVSKNTTLLVYNDGEESSAKYKTAKKLGIKTISKSQFAKKHNLT